MSSDDLEPTRRRLSQWRVDAPTDTDLAGKVLRRIRNESAPPATDRLPLTTWLQSLWRQPVYAGAIALFLILTGVMISNVILQFRGQSESVAPTDGYRIAIDPLYRLTESLDALAMGRPSSDVAVGESLEWLRSELGLADQQFHKLASLHEEFSPTFANIFRDLQQQKAEVEHFEAMRQERELIDFIQVYRVTTNYRDLQYRSSTSTAELVARVSQLVDAKQRSRYLELLSIAPEQSTNVDEATPRHA